MDSTFPKTSISRALFRLSKINKIHIIGCSRSGTTMLHLGMVHFRHVILAPNESSIAHPFLRERLRVVGRSFRTPGKTHYITKRDHGWFLTELVDQAVKEALTSNIGVIHIVRDPRDVMSSKHQGDRSHGSYVSFEHWKRSVLAGEQMFRLLGDHERKAEIRYEDLVQDPGVVEEELCAKFGLAPRDPGRSIAQLKENLEATGQTIHPDLVLAVHRIRNMDPNSAFRWKHSPPDLASRIQSPSDWKLLSAFLEKHGYDPV